jgi:L-seryl-tRNA(Ser) seleniumtransferase
MAVPDLRALPSVEYLLQTPQAVEFTAVYGRPLTLEAVRLVLAEVRAGGSGSAVLPSPAEILQTTGLRLADWSRPGLVPVINASGVILHTNLGRAPLSRAALQAIQETAQGYSNLEYDLDTGSRGSRLMHLETLLARLTGAEAALVVNNNAAAVLLVLTALARRKRVITSRAQLVEIGGGFRIPDILAQSGARLAEVGTTNRVRLADYQTALAEPAGLVLYTHPSNFRMIGFTGQPELPEIARVAHQAGVPLVIDLGSGALIDTAPYGLAHELTVAESLAAAADLVCFSGDKLLGGPQAGIIVGKADTLARLKKHPLTRAMRADKLCLAALSATLLHYLKNEASLEIPIWQMIAASTETLQRRAQHWADSLGTGRVIPGESTVGGGALPGETLPSALLCLDVRSPNRFLSRLRALPTPVVARILDEKVVLDPRTVLPFQEGALLSGLRQVLGK